MLSSHITSHTRQQQQFAPSSTEQQQQIATPNIHQLIRPPPPLLYLTPPKPPSQVHSLHHPLEECHAATNFLMQPSQTARMEAWRQCAESAVL